MQSDRTARSPARIHERPRDRCALLPLRGSAPHHHATGRQLHDRTPKHRVARYTEATVARIHVRRRQTLRCLAALVFDRKSVLLMEAPPAGLRGLRAPICDGDTIRQARRMRLIEMEPREDLCSPRHAPVDPGVENLALEPDPTEGFTVTLELGTYWVEWCGLDDREAVEAGTCRPSAGGPVRLRAPRRGRRERTVPDRDVTRAAAGREAIG